MQEITTQDIRPKTNQEAERIHIFWNHYVNEAMPNLPSDRREEIAKSLTEISSHFDTVFDLSIVGSSLRICDKTDDTNTKRFRLDLFMHQKNPFAVLCRSVGMTANWSPTPGRKGNVANWSFGDHIYFAASLVLVVYHGHAIQ